MPANKHGDTPGDVDFSFDAWERDTAVRPFAVVVDGKRYESVDPLDLDYREFEGVSATDAEAQFKMLFPTDHEAIRAAKVIKMGALAEFNRRVVEHYGMGDTPALVDLMRVYGAAIERDLFDRGWDLRALWRERRWRLLLNVTEHLPRDSAVGEALALDESLVDGTIAASVAWRPSLRDWSGQADLLAAVHDRLGELLVVEGAKRAQVRPYPRPVTAADVVRARQRHADRARLMTRIADAQARATDQTTD